LAAHYLNKIDEQCNQPGCSLHQETLGNRWPSPPWAALQTKTGSLPRHVTAQQPIAGGGAWAAFPHQRLAPTESCRLPRKAECAAMRDLVRGSLKLSADGMTC